MCHEVQNVRKLILDATIRQKIVDIQSGHNFERETGGILVGLYDAELEAIRITDMSSAYPSDRRSRFCFLRNSTGHQALMDNLWFESEKTKAYLGEWHTHDQNVPIPSTRDHNTWKRISGLNNNFDQCFFIIIGREHFGVWTVAEGHITEIAGDEWDGERQE